MKLSRIIKKPIVTEKSFSLANKGEYVFKVNLSATKGAIAEEVENLFNVDVINVKTTIIPGKRKRILRTRMFSKTPKWKKAFVKLKEGQKIDLIESEEK